MRRLPTAVAAAVLLTATTFGYLGHRLELGTHAEGVQAASLPAQIDSLGTDPVGVAAFGNVFAFPLFTLDGRTSAVALYDSITGVLSKFPVPAELQGKFAYAVAGDKRTETLWVGTAGSLVQFNVVTHAMHDFGLPPPGRPYPGLADTAPARVVGLTVDNSGHVWLTRDFDNAITEFDPSTDRFRELSLPSGIVGGSIAALSDALVATSVYRTNDPRYEVNGANMDTGYVVVDLRTLRATFKPGMTTALLPLGSGRVAVVSRGEVDEFDVGNGAPVQTLPLETRSMDVGVATSPTDESLWVGAGASIEQFVGNQRTVYSIPPRCGVPPSTPAQATPPASYICTYPGAKAVAVAANGTVAIVLGGYDAIALVRG